MSICQNVMFDALYFTFSKKSNSILFWSYAFNNPNECGKNNFAQPVLIPSGVSTVIVQMHFDKGMLSAFNCNYRTNKVEIKQSRGIISQMELLGSNLNIQRFRLGNFRIDGFHNFTMYFNGSLEGLRIADIEKEYSDSMVINHKVISGDFLFDIFNN